MVGASLLGLKSPPRRHQMSGTERDASPSLTAFAWTGQDAPYNLNFCFSPKRGFGFVAKPFVVQFGLLEACPAHPRAFGATGATAPSQG